MKRLVALLIVFVSASLPAIADAQPYNAFGNDKVGDCTFETIANLTLHEFPTAHITTAEVIAAWAPNPYGGGNDSIVGGIAPAQLFLQTTGFDGHRAASATNEIYSQPQLVAAANHGGIYVSVIGPSFSHALAIISATRTHVTTVNDGQVVSQSWSWFRFIWTHTVVPIAGSTTQQGKFVPTGEKLTYYAITW